MGSATCVTFPVDVATMTRAKSHKRYAKGVVINSSLCLQAKAVNWHRARAPRGGIAGGGLWRGNQGVLVAGAPGGEPLGGRAGATAATPAVLLGAPPSPYLGAPDAAGSCTRQRSAARAPGGASAAGAAVWLADGAVPATLLALPAVGEAAPPT